MRYLARCLILVLGLLLVSGCDQNIECIEADDWGQQINYTISGNNNNNFQVNPDHTQIGLWNNSQLILNGKNLVGVVKNSLTIFSQRDCGSLQSDCSSAHGGYCSGNTWTAWFGDWGSGKDNGLCQFDGGWCPTGISMSADIPVTAIPCLFYRGLGLYAAISDNYETTLNPMNPFANNTVCSQGNISNCFLHIGEGANNPTFYDNYCPANGFMIEPPSGCTDATHQCGINFKISDRYYPDNAGAYTIIFKQGVMSQSYTGPLSKFAQQVSGILCNTTSSLYSTIVNETSYRSYIGVLLILFIALMGVSFITGMSSMTHTELIIRAMKFGLIAQLVSSDASWQFFYDYFFSFFINGIGEITGILFGEASFAQNIGTTQPGQCAPNVSGLQAFDSAIQKLFSYETTRKIMSLLVWKIYGGVFIIAVYIMVLVILFTIVKAVLIFFVSFLAISILIVLAPIFIPFILFSVTRSFFENWLKQLVSHFIQPIIILTFAFFMVTMLMNQLEFLFGYRVCWKEWFHIPVIDLDFYAWQSDYDNNTRGCLPTPNSIYSEDQQGNYTIENAPGANSCGTGNGVSYSGKCTPYTCYQNRYIGFPYLDPQDSIDQDRIHQLQNNELITFIDLVIMFVMVWFMVKFNKVVPDIAKRLGGTMSARTNVAQAGRGLAGGLGKAMTRGGAMMLNPLYKRVTGRDIRQDAKTLRRRLFFEQETDKEKELRKLKDEHSDLLLGLRGSAANRNKSLEEKTKEARRIKEIKSRMKTLEKEIKYDKTPKSFLARAEQTGSMITGGAEELAKKPGKALLKPLKKVGQKTVGRVARRISKTIDGPQNKNKDTDKKE